MDKTEVTNAEYQEFIKATGYKAIPAHWVNGAPITGQETMPVRFVNLDDVKAFAVWRSKRDNVTYRLPTEEEWEFAARNGSKDTLYPWGDKFDPKCAVIDENTNEPKAVGTHSCANDWGVQDLIGNVFEWTMSPPATYQGNKSVTTKPMTESVLIVRGGSMYQKSTGQMAITSTFRIDTPANKRSAELGFRLVRSQ